MKPACAPQTNAQSSQNSAGSPKRPAGLVRRRSRTTSSTVRPLVFAWMAMVERNRSVSKGPGRSWWIVTLGAPVLRASPATNPVSPARAPFESPRMSIGCFTALDVMLTIRPKRRAIMPSTVALMRRIGVIMFASTARIHVSRSQSRKSPGGGPPALLTRMSGAGHAVSSAARPASVVTSPATAVTRTPVASRSSFSAASRASFVRAISVRLTPSRASDMAHALPSPPLDARLIAFPLRLPRSNLARLPYRIGRAGAEQEGRHERHREGREHRDGAPGRPERPEVRLEGDDVVRPVLDRRDVGDRGELRQRLGAVSDAGGRRVLEDDDRQVGLRGDLGEVAQRHLGFPPGAPHEQRRREDEDGRRALGLGVARQLDRLLRAVGIDPCDDVALPAHLIDRDREGAPALLARERRDLGGVAVGDDPGDTAGVGEPAQVLPVRGLVDREVRRERQEVRGHDPRELHHVDTSSVISLAGTTRPYARPMISEWRSAETVRVRVTRVRDSGAGRGPQLSPLTARTPRHEACLSCVPSTKEARYAHALQPSDCRRRAVRPRLGSPAASHRRHYRRDGLLPRARGLARARSPTRRQRSRRRNQSRIRRRSLYSLSSGDSRAPAREARLPRRDDHDDDPRGRPLQLSARQSAGSGGRLLEDAPRRPGDDRYRREQRGSVYRQQRRRPELPGERLQRGAS